ncbi:hypothetical protein DE146DRAFT_741090 [Phaeosphaeria sp. MPI-PUGE-AT-0046c]|nr:hypothetical protein DE146DRAFT_741090 [Phaeosphaeria sp. MPI-PUGE-AT-0046c]
MHPPSCSAFASRHQSNAPSHQAARLQAVNKATISPHTPPLPSTTRRPKLNMQRGPASVLAAARLSWPVHPVPNPRQSDHSPVCPVQPITAVMVPYELAAHSAGCSHRLSADRPACANTLCRSPGKQLELKSAMIEWGSDHMDSGRYDMVKADYVELSASLASTPWPYYKPMIAPIESVYPSDMDRENAIDLEHDLHKDIVDPNANSASVIYFDTPEHSAPEVLTSLPIVAITLRTVHENETICGLVIREQDKTDENTMEGFIYVMILLLPESAGFKFLLGP